MTDTVGTGTTAAEDLVAAPIRTLLTRWRADSAVLRRRGAVVQADVLEGCARDLEAFETERALEVLTLEEAERESGYSYSSLEKWVRRGDIENAGAKGRPRIRRRDLPKKAARAPRAPDLAGPVLEGKVHRRLAMLAPSSQGTR